MKIINECKLTVWITSVFILCNIDTQAQQVLHQDASNKSITDSIQKSTNNITSLIAWITKSVAVSSSPVVDSEDENITLRDMTLNQNLQSEHSSDNTQEVMDSNSTESFEQTSASTAGQRDITSTLDDRILNTNSISLGISEFMQINTSAATESFDTNTPTSQYEPTSTMYNSSTHLTMIEPVPTPTESEENVDEKNIKSLKSMTIGSKSHLAVEPDASTPEDTFTNFAFNDMTTKSLFKNSSSLLHVITLQTDSTLFTDDGYRTNSTQDLTTVTMLTDSRIEVVNPKTMNNVTEGLEMSARTLSDSPENRDVRIEDWTSENLTSTSVAGNKTGSLIKEEHSARLTVETDESIGVNGKSGLIQNRNQFDSTTLKTLERFETERNYINYPESTTALCCAQDDDSNDLKLPDKSVNVTKESSQLNDKIIREADPEIEKSYERKDFTDTTDTSITLSNSTIHAIEGGDSATKSTVTPGGNTGQDNNIKLTELRKFTTPPGVTLNRAGDVNGGNKNSAWIKDKDESNREDTLARKITLNYAPMGQQGNLVMYQRVDSITLDQASLLKPEQSHNTDQPTTQRYKQYLLPTVQQRQHQQQWQQQQQQQKQQQQQQQQHPQMQKQHQQQQQPEQLQLQLQLQQEKQQQKPIIQTKELQQLLRTGSSADNNFNSKMQQKQQMKHNYNSPAKLYPYVKETEVKEKQNKQQQNDQNEEWISGDTEVDTPLTEEYLKLQTTKKLSPTISSPNVSQVSPLSQASPIGSPSSQTSQISQDISPILPASPSPLSPLSSQISQLSPNVLPQRSPQSQVLPKVSPALQISLPQQDDNNAPILTQSDTHHSVYDQMAPADRPPHAMAYPQFSGLESMEVNQNISASPGSRATLKCRVENLGTKTVIWRKDGQVHPLAIGLFPFAADSRISADFSQRTSEWMLVIEDLKPSDEGLYHCTVSMKEKHENNQNIRLNVKTVQVTGTQYVERGDPIRLECVAAGRPHPPDDVTWFKSRLPLHSDITRDVIITKNIETRQLISVLTIQNSIQTDAAEYTCRSTNQDEANINVYVLNVVKSSRVGFEKSGI